MQSSELRQKFLTFFEAHGHTIVPSASLVPARDATLLFVNSGMVPFKDVYLGAETRSYTRATSSQRCLRVSGKHNDLEEVGPSPQHQTFFEMLGNFSFGDYFKEEAIEFAWEFLTKELGLPADSMHPTVYEEDDESPATWARVKGIPESQVTRLGAEDNFWSMGDTGPCGPNSEIIFDRTGACLKDGSDCDLTCDCNRWWELWNLVFMQFDRGADGALTPLPKVGVDTGLGLDRLAAVLQDVPSTYETDLFAPLIERLQALTGDAEISAERLPWYRAVADHARAVTFLITDGVLPSNEGRGYVTRRILRRASYQGRLLGLVQPFLSRICRAVIDEMSAAYPELAQAQERVLESVADEEERFHATLETGLTRLDEAVAQSDPGDGGTMLPGEEAFRLYDTFGFPIDLTRKVLEGRGWSVDEEGFDRALEEQRERARGARAVDRAQDEALVASLSDVSTTRFVGYETLTAEASVLAIFGEQGRITEAREGDEVDLLLDATPFYAEAGGQVGDQGSIVGPEGEIEIESVRTVGQGLIAHRGRVARGGLAAGASVRAEVDESIRRATMRNHTATHLLHKALRDVLGPQAKQAGSLVAPDRLRFDFLHGQPLTDEELRQAERIVREQIVLNQPVRTDLMAIQDAIDLGADAMFDEKYGEEARVVSVGDQEEPFSRELCGGTHCQATGEIGAFFIVEQRSVGAGLRRVEAVTGLGAFDWADLRRRVVDELSHDYNAPPQELPDRLRELQERAQKRPAAAHAALPDPADVLARAERRDGASIIVERIDGADAVALRGFGDELRRRATSAAIVLGTIVEEKPSIVIMLTTDQVEAGLHAGEMAKQLGKEMGAGGGGRPDSATAGGRDASRLDAGLALAKRLLHEAG